MMDLGPICLLAQGRGSDDWIQLVVLMVMLLLSAVVGLFKRYRESRRQRAETAPTPPGQTTRAPANWRQKLEQELERVRTETARRMGEAEDERDTVASPSRPSTPEPNVRSTMAKTRERELAAKKAVAEASDIKKSALETPEPMRASKPQAVPVSAPTANRGLIDLTDPDALRRAIIQYEILGKPLGLRDLSSECGPGRIY